MVYALADLYSPGPQTHSLELSYNGTQILCTPFSGEYIHLYDLRIGVCMEYDEPLFQSLPQLLQASHMAP